MTENKFTDSIEEQVSDAMLSRYEQELQNAVERASQLRLMIKELRGADLGAEIVKERRNRYSRLGPTRHINKFLGQMPVFASAREIAEQLAKESNEEISSYLLQHIAGEMNRLYHQGWVGRIAHVGGVYHYGLSAYFEDDLNTVKARYEYMIPRKRP